jgi:hypothetical protein
MRRRELHPLEASAGIGFVVGFDHVEQMREGGALNFGTNRFACLHVADPLLEQPHSISAIGGVNILPALLSVVIYLDAFLNRF